MINLLVFKGMISELYFSKKYKFQLKFQNFQKKKNQKIIKK